MTAPEHKPSISIPLWLIAVAALVFIFAGLGSYAILDNNEGLYAEIPREMLAAHDWRAWIIPHLNGLPYMEKPPLLYWLTALSFALFGIAEWSARLVPACSALGCMWLLVWFGRKVGRAQAGRLAALMFVSGTGVTAMSRVLMFDMLLTVLLTAALMHAYLFFRSGLAQHLRWAYGFAALALLAKGLVALILFGFVLVAWLFVMHGFSRQFWQALRKCFDPLAVLVFTALAVPWHVAASLTEPVFAWFYFINEHVLRFLGRREPHDYYAGAWWYYLPRMVIYLFPWSFLLVGMWPRTQRIEDKAAISLRRFLALAWLAPLLFFSISSAKANYYLVAVMPFAALHLAIAVEERADRSGAGRLLPGLLLAVLALILCAVLAVRGISGRIELTILGLPQQQFIMGVLAGLAFLGALSGWLARRAPRIGVQAYLVPALWVGAALMAVLLAMEPWVSTRQTAQFLQNSLAGRTVYLFRNFEEQSSLPFYLRHPVMVVDSRSNDLFWGNKLRHNDIVITNDEFGRRVQTQKVAIVVLERFRQDFLAGGYASQFTGQKRIGGSWIFYN